MEDKNTHASQYLDQSLGLRVLLIQEDLPWGFYVRDQKLGGGAAVRAVV